MTKQPITKHPMTKHPLIEPTWVSIDVETSGPDPSTHALLSVGASLVAEPEVGFYVELKPDQKAADPQAMAVHGLDMRRLRTTGAEPATAMASLEAWLKAEVVGRPTMVGFNAPFDWMFVNQYFWYYLGRNPLGHSAIDIKALAMGWLCVPWSQTSFAALATRCGLASSLGHHALDDARQQARLLAALLALPRPARPRTSASRKVPAQGRKASSE